MKKIKLFLIINLFLFLISCGTVREGFQNPKKNNTDEFLVEKKSPLVMPPDFEDLPKPENDKSESSADNEIKLFKSDGEQKSNKNAISKDIEGSILEKIKSN
tara:strand:- start:7920 stop:8225 length:306 start_codon:yes stop_codon:yes gene_type:complete